MLVTGAGVVLGVLLGIWLFRGLVRDGSVKKVHDALDRLTGNSRPES